MIPKGELVPLKPRLIGQESKLPEHKKTKLPKIVPYEPYPGAVKSLEANAKGSISGQSTTRISSSLRYRRASEPNVYNVCTRAKRIKNAVSNISNEEVRQLKGELEKFRGKTQVFCVKLL